MGSTPSERSRDEVRGSAQLEVAAQERSQVYAVDDAVVVEIIPTPVRGARAARPDLGNEHLVVDAVHAVPDRGTVEIRRGDRAVPQLDALREDPAAPRACARGD